MNNYQITHQSIGEQGLTFELTDGQQVYQLSKGLVKEAEFGYPISNCCTTFELDNIVWDSITAIKYQNIFQSLCALFPYKTSTASEFPIDRLLGMYVLSTYCHRLFNSHGILFLSDIKEHIILDYLHILKRLCLNGYIVNPHDGPLPIRHFIFNNSATLIFEEPNKYRSAIQKLCLMNQNHSSQRYHQYDGDLESTIIYSPKVVVTNKSNYGDIYRYAIPIRGHRLQQPLQLTDDKINEFHIAALHFSLVAQKTINEFIDETSRSISENNPYFILIVMAKSLEVLGIINSNELKIITIALEYLLELYQRDRIYNADKEILRFAAYFIRDQGLGELDQALIPTEACMAYIKTSKDADSIFKSTINPTRLISTLKKYQITKKHKRPLVDLITDDGKNIDHRSRMCWFWDIKTLKMISGIETSRKGAKNDIFRLSPSQTTDSHIGDEGA